MKFLSLCISETTILIQFIVDTEREARTSGTRHSISGSLLKTKNSLLLEKPMQCLKKGEKLWAMNLFMLSYTFSHHHLERLRSQYLNYEGICSCQSRLFLIIALYPALLSLPFFFEVTMTFLLFPWFA